MLGVWNDKTLAGFIKSFTEETWGVLGMKLISFELSEIVQCVMSRVLKRCRGRGSQPLLYKKYFILCQEKKLYANILYLWLSCTLSAIEICQKRLSTCHDNLSYMHAVACQADGVRMFLNNLSLLQVCQTFLWECSTLLVIVGLA